ncbi:hypothetical protein KKC17_03190 [Patescibacteria group bacterium]|nr:hypothetical protein [Patescibacteria group bacterium]
MNEKQLFTESKEVLKEQPNITVYLIRHGESGKDKTNPKRGLTDKGREQVKETITNIAKQIISDEQSDFKDWNNKQAYAEVLQKSLDKIKLFIRDSKTDRTCEQDWVMNDTLIELGARPDQIDLPKSAYEWKGENIPTEAGPGVEKRLKGIQGIEHEPDFRKKLGDTSYQEKLGAKDEIVAWALTPDDEIPTAVETKSQMLKRKNIDMAKVEKIADWLSNKGQEKRIVYIANSHASMTSLIVADELNIPLEKVGEVENAEGVRLDFYGQNKKKAKPVGKNIEKIATEI